MTLCTGCLEEACCTTVNAKSRNTSGWTGVNSLCTAGTKYSYIQQQHNTVLGRKVKTWSLNDHWSDSSSLCDTGIKIETEKAMCHLNENERGG